MDLTYYNIKQVYFSDNNLKFKSYFSIFRDYSNKKLPTLFVGINNLYDYNLLYKHIGLRYIFWFPDDIIDNIYLNNLKSLKIDKHYGNMLKTEIYFKKYKLNYGIIYDYFNSYETKFKILTNKKLESIAINLNDNLHDLNFKSEVIYDFSNMIECKSYIFILIYIKYFTQLNNIPPRKYIFYQLEQNTSNYFTDKYINLMNNSIKIFDFSKCNNVYYDKINLKKLFLAPFPLPKQIETCTNEFDILFYGQMSNRREQILKYLEKDFNIIYKDNIFGDEKNNLIKKCKILLNLHFYENACLETCRINEALKYSKLIVSERGHILDDDIYNIYSNCVIFCENIDENLSNINLIKNRIKFCLNNYEKLVSNMDIKNIYNMFKSNLQKNIILNEL